jgi:putative PIN family toxin of toxin-antitoxin system
LVSKLRDVRQFMETPRAIAKLATPLLQSLLHEARLVEIREKVQACRDPKGDRFLELAVNGEANCIVSGDEDLLSLDRFRGILSEDRPEEK